MSPTKTKPAPRPTRTWLGDVSETTRRRVDRTLGLDRPAAGDRVDVAAFSSSV